MIQAAIAVSLPSFPHLSTSAKQTDLKACPDDSSALLAADTWTRGCLGWEKKEKKATAEALLDLQTFVTDGVSSLTLSCLTKTSPRLKRHPSVLVVNNDRLPFDGTQSIWIFSLLPLLYLW